MFVRRPFLSCSAAGVQKSLKVSATSLFSYETPLYVSALLVIMHNSMKGNVSLSPNL